MTKTPLLDRRSIEAGKVIFEQGDNGDAAYVVESGEVAVFKEIDGERVRLGSIKPGGIFGEMAVIDGSPRMATAIADTHTVLVRVPKAVFDGKLAACDPFIRGLIAIFLANIRAAHKLYNKRPRSLADHLRMLDAYSMDLTTYINGVDVADFSPDMVTALNDLNDAIARVRVASRDHHDRRDSVIDTDDLKGVNLRAVLERG
ncbi:cyclic nucleotide-binding domain-containing protein [Magnetospirillum sp. UT-4]|uniref:cyclic nucleotide-binding domain-containing protein n=1 Tax=Magnetospirillum sp. UT-4 TaxID=2681467 RepID=UPI001384A4F2|nr:cyclic nucleotide-binding domain-containing protein [Magnetospirillum sp. UT-4]CAA7624606.1 putative cAMP-binding protein [Magnetospirillum sp. UT-4]